MATMRTFTSGLTAQQCKERFGYDFFGDPDTVVCDKVIQWMVDLEPMEQRSDAWYAARKKVLSASDAASALGLNKHQPVTALLQDKVFGSTFTGNEATAWGQKLEPLVTERFAKERNVAIFEFGLVPHKKYKFLGGSPDGVLSNGQSLEIKCPLNRKIVPGSIPIYYQPQVQMQMELLDFEIGWFVQYRPAEIEDSGTEVFDVTMVARDRDWFKTFALPRMTAFWKEVMFYREHPYMLCTIDTEMYPEEEETVE
jgi:putative phage-type endonuclease